MSQAESEELPDVSKEKYFHVDDALKDLFGSGKQPKLQEEHSGSEMIDSDNEQLGDVSAVKSTNESFSLLSMFGQVEDTPNSKNNFFYTFNL